MTEHFEIHTAKQILANIKFQFGDSFHEFGNFVDVSRKKPKGGKGKDSWLYFVQLAGNGAVNICTDKDDQVSAKWFKELVLDHQFFDQEAYLKHGFVGVLFNRMVTDEDNPDYTDAVQAGAEFLEEYLRQYRDHVCG
jgi:hypothetical protein